MIGFIVRRLGLMLVLLVVLAGSVFVLQRYTPADPVRVKLGPNAPAEVVEAERARLGYDDPVPVQFGRYLGDLATGDLGDSLRTRRPVTEDIAAFLPATIELVLGIVLVSAIGGIALALATTGDSRRAAVLRFSMTGAAAAPAFLLVLVALLLFYRNLGWVPNSGRTSYLDAPDGPTGLLTVDSLVAGRVDVFVDALHHLVLPVLAGAIASTVAVARVLRSGLIEVMRADHIRTARAKGLEERRVLVRHALRNACGPALSLAGLLVASMFAGTLVIEQLVAWPGLGAYTVRSIDATDFPAIAGVTLVLGAIVIMVNTTIEILQSVADPRIRL
ncbi:MAG: ABC transporter permease [Acidimicrobiales bacterium]